MQTANIISPVNIDHRKNLDIRTGDTVRVWSKVVEKGKTRLQAFEGLVLARKHGSEAGATFTVRKIASGVGVERIFPLYSPSIDKIELVKRAKSRRSKLYYIREKAAKEIRRKMRALHIELPDFGESADSADKTQINADEKSTETAKAVSDSSLDTSEEVFRESETQEVMAEETKPEVAEEVKPVEEEKETEEASEDKKETENPKSSEAELDK